MKNYIIKKDILSRKKFFKYEKKRRLYKHFQQNLQLPAHIRMYYTIRLNTELPIRSSISRLTNRCIVTGRSRSVYSDFRLTRMQLRHLASFGYLMGIKKSSW